MRYDGGMQIFFIWLCEATRKCQRDFHFTRFLILFAYLTRISHLQTRIDFSPLSCGMFAVRTGSSDKSHCHCHFHKESSFVPFWHVSYGLRHHYRFHRRYVKTTLFFPAWMSINNFLCMKYQVKKQFFVERRLLVKRRLCGGDFWILHFYSILPLSYFLLLRGAYIPREKRFPFELRQ